MGHLNEAENGFGDLLGIRRTVARHALRIIFGHACLSLGQVLVGVQACRIAWFGHVVAK